MERTANCGFFGCSQLEGALQETAQEQLSSNYSHQRTNKMAKPAERPIPLSPGHKEIFSFKLNCFRNTHLSDKPRPLPHQYPTTLVETPVKLLNFRSCQKDLSIPSQTAPEYRQTQRVFRSPPPNLQMRVLREQRSPEAKRSMMLSPTYQQQSVRITFNTSSEADQSQVDGNSKNSEHTHYSSKKSDVHLPNINKAFSNENELDFGDKWTIQTEKCSTLKSCIFGNGGETHRTLIDYLNEDQPAKDNGEQLNKKQNDFPSHPYSNQTRNGNYSPIVEQRALRNHHHTVIVRTLPTATHAIPYRINA